MTMNEIRVRVKVACKELDDAIMIEVCTAVCANFEFVIDAATSAIEALEKEQAKDKACCRCHATYTLVSTIGGAAV